MNNKLPTCVGVWFLLTAGLLSLVCLSGCSAVNVYRADGTRVKGIPFVAKKVVAKQESVWQLNAMAIGLSAVSEKNDKTNDLGTVIVPFSRYQEFKGLFSAPMDMNEINKALLGFIASRTPKDYLSADLALISNRRTLSTVFDTNTYYINAQRPLVGSVGFTPELNADGQLTKVAATAEDKTIPTFLDPFKDALGAAAAGVLGVTSPATNLFNVEFTKADPKGVALITVTKELKPSEAVGQPIRPPGILSAEEKDGKFEGLDVVVSFPEDKKPTNEAPAFKFSGSITPPK